MSFQLKEVAKCQDFIFSKSLIGLKVLTLPLSQESALACDPSNLMHLMKVKIMEEKKKKNASLNC